MIPSDEMVEAACRSWHGEEWWELARPDELRAHRGGMARALGAALAVSGWEQECVHVWRSSFGDTFCAKCNQDAPVPVQQDEPEGRCLECGAKLVGGKSYCQWCDPVTRAVPVQQEPGTSSEQQEPEGCPKVPPCSSNPLPCTCGFTPAAHSSDELRERIAAILTGAGDNDGPPEWRARNRERRLALADEILAVLPSVRDEGRRYRQERDEAIKHLQRVCAIDAGYDREVVSPTLLRRIRRASRFLSRVVAEGNEGKR